MPTKSLYLFLSSGIFYLPVTSKNIDSFDLKNLDATQRLDIIMIVFNEEEIKV